jgi:hypothetical protein
MSKIIMSIVMLLAMSFAASAFEITAPSGAYNMTAVPLSIESNTTLDNISYQVDNGSLIHACTNCSGFNATLNASEGNHSVTAMGALGNETFSDAANFSVSIPVVIINTTNTTNYSIADSFGLKIIEPQSRAYFEKNVPVIILANTTLDSISVNIGNTAVGCQNCSGYNGKLNLSAGNYTLKATGMLGNLSKNVSVSFTVLKMKNETQHYLYNWSENRFGHGFEKLPKMFDIGNLTDAELAALIRANKLNPGILQKLIKTGKLGNESLTAILDTQWMPKGIFKKLFSRLYHEDSYAELIYKYYKLSPSLQQKLLVRDDLQREFVNRIMQSLREHENWLQQQMLNQSWTVPRESHMLNRSVEQHNQTNESQNHKIQIRERNQSQENNTVNEAGHGKAMWNKPIVIAKQNGKGYAQGLPKKEKAQSHGNSGNGNKHED